MKSSDKNGVLNINRMGSRVRYGFVTAILACLAVSGQAQVPGRPDIGVSPVGSYSVSDIENISLTNGNVNLSIPLASLPPMPGSKLSWTIRAIYNSKLWNVTREERTDGGIPPTNWVVDNLQVNDSSGWQIGGSYMIDFRPIEADFAYLIPGTNDPDRPYLLNSWTKVFLRTPDGAEHELRPMDFPSFPGSREYLMGYYRDTPFTTGNTMRYYSFDGSYIFATIDPPGANWTVYLPDGTRVKQQNDAQRIIDTNGNAVKIFCVDDGFGNQTTHFQDERSLSSGPAREITYTTGPAGSYVRYQTAGGNWATITLNFGETVVGGKTYQVKDKCSPLGVGNRTTALLDTAITVLRSITLPQTQPGLPGRQFSFSYNSDTTDNVNLTWKPACGAPNQTITVASHGMGGLSRMVTPSGAIIDYNYSRDGQPHHLLGFATNAPKETIKSKVLNHDGVADTWTYAFTNTSGIVTGPDGSSTTETFHIHDAGWPGWAGGVTGKGGLVYRTNKSGKILIERHWTPLIFNLANGVATGGQVPFNPVVDAEYTTLFDNGEPVKMFAKTFQYDFNGNLLQSTEYNWFHPISVSRDEQGVPTGVPANTNVLRTTTTSHYNQAAGPSSGNVYAKRDVSTGAPLILNAPQQTTTGPSQTRFSYDNQAYGITPTTGNLTGISKWDDQAGAWRTTTYGYDTYGNSITVTDPNNNVTNIAFDPATHAQPTQVTVNPLNGTGAQTTTTVYDYWTGLVTSVTDPNNQTTTTSYINQLLGAVDPFGRPGLMTGPPVNSVVDGVTYTNQQGKAKTTYFDDARQVVVESDLNQSGDFRLKSRASRDQLGRVIMTESNEDGAANYTISAQTVYVQMGLITLTSNPKRSAAATTDGWTRATSDTLGRVIEVATFSGATPPPTTGTNSNWTGSVTTNYNANQTTVTDQAGKKRQSKTDALGRLAEVIEDPGGLNHETFYLYDALGNLRKVTQGAQTRWFAYDSLSRLIRAKNPEQNTNGSLPPHTDPLTGNSGWAMAYSYDANGNLTQRIDARGVVTNYFYDALNRNNHINYLNGSQTRTVGMGYDEAVNGKGRLHRTGTVEGGVNVTHMAIDSYDALGRPLTKRQHFWQGTDWGPGYYVQQTYDLAGNVKTLTYPSGRIVNYSHDQAGRLSSFTGNLGGSPSTYADTIGYNAAGQMIKERFGTNTPLYHKKRYNSRLQLGDVRLSVSSNALSSDGGALLFYYGPNAVSTNDSLAGDPTNNGNLIAQAHFAPIPGGGAVIPQSDLYTYDPLNRISSVVERQFDANGTLIPNVFTQDFGYDRYGNRRITSATGGVNNYNPTYDPASNRIIGPSYDAAGNQTNEGSGERIYDGENRMVEAYNNAGVRVSWYVYDADGRRVARTVGSQTTWQIYGCGGELLAEYAVGASPSAPQKEYGYRSGQMLVVWDGSETGDQQLQWLVQDHLGSTRMVVDRSGSLGGVRRHDFLPFGEELSAGVGIRSAALGYGPDSTRQKYTGKERDSETGLDFFEARYFSSVQGRFTSPDEPFAGQDIDDPQSWNLYTYTLNNPLKYVDPSGKGPIPIVPPILYSPAFIERATNFRNGFGFRSIEQVRAETERRRAFLREQAKNQPLGSLISRNAQGQYHRVDIDNLDQRQVWAFYDQSKSGAVERIQLSDDQIKTLRDLLDGVQIAAGPIKEVFNSIWESGQVPQGWRPLRDGTTKVNINDKELLDQLRNVLPGKWKKVYKVGVDGTEIHYFEHASGKVFNVKPVVK